jgi:uncharacterized protein
MAEPSIAVSMKIQVGGLSEGIHEFQFSAEGSVLDLEFASLVSVHVSLEKAGSQIFLTGTVQTEGTFTCDRCLASFTRPLSSTYRMYYLFDSAEAGRFDPAEVQVISTSLSIIDITDDVRQTLLLAVPLKLVCSETCKGLCPTCGTNWNLEVCDCHEEVADPRWEELKKFRDTDSR